MPRRGELKNYCRKVNESRLYQVRFYSAFFCGEGLLERKTTSTSMRIPAGGMYSLLWVSQRGPEDKLWTSFLLLSLSLVLSRSLSFFDGRKFTESTPEMITVCLQPDTIFSPQSTLYHALRTPQPHPENKYRSARQKTGSWSQGNRRG